MPFHRKRHKGKCPAIGKICLKCKKPNHLATVCRSSFVNHIDHRHPGFDITAENAQQRGSTVSAGNITHTVPTDSDEENDAYIYAVKGVAINRVNTKTHVKICNRNILMQVDSGSDVNIRGLYTTKFISISRYF